MALFVKNPKAGDYDFDGVCKPRNTFMAGQYTFSVGVFQWVQKKDGKGIKKSKVIKRFKGPYSNPEEVYKAARKFIMAMENGDPTPKKQTS